RKLLDGSFGTSSFQVGSNAYETIDVGLKGAKASDIGSYQLGNTGGTAATKAAKLLAAADVTAFGAITITGSGKTEAVTLASTSAKGAAGELDGKIPGLSATARTEFKASIAGVANGEGLSFTVTVGSQSVDLKGISNT